MSKVDSGKCPAPAATQKEEKVMSGRNIEEREPVAAAGIGENPR